MTTTPTLLERYRGCLLGVATGDALGTTLEFTPPGPHNLTDMVGGGPFRLKPGQWTDDTSMTLCLAVSLLVCGGFDATNQFQMFSRWQRTGYLSSTGLCFDIGGACARGIRAWRETGALYPGEQDPEAAGNGALMRIAPIALAYRKNLAAAGVNAELESRMTHGHQASHDACVVYTDMIIAALEGKSKTEILHCANYLLPHMHPEIAAVLTQRPEHAAIRGSGYVVDSLRAALFAFEQFDTFEEGALFCANLGEDADTTASIYSSLAGAYYGIDGIPTKWVRKVYWNDKILGYADDLLDLSEALS